jgi:hypothetical protein
MDGVNGKRELIVADALSMHIAFLVNQFAVQRVAIASHGGVYCLVNYQG